MQMNRKWDMKIEGALYLGSTMAASVNYYFIQHPESKPWSP